jgi:aspartyl-tRNA(Asn)/glutamyl-tRNA(Gln) amidotransferase subunit C
MTTGFTREEIAAIAALARLELEPAELDLFVRQLSDILAYADEVQQIDTTGVPPTASVVTPDASDRPDQVCPSLDIGEALANAPDRDLTRITGGFFKVPRVIG